MRRILKWSISMTVVVALSALAVYAVSNGDSHQFKDNQCLFCHVNFNLPLQFRDNITTLCNYCHKNDKSVSHIVGVKPTMKIPQDFHLDSDGVMTCATCHDVHMHRYDSNKGRTYLLRQDARGREYCNLCHEDPSEIVTARKTGTHAGLIESAHFGYYTSGEYSAIDRISLLCISCHEGTLGSGVHVNTKKGSGIGDSHRIGMNYMKIQRKKSSGFRSPGSLNPEVKLFGGKVGCTSCHNPFKLGPHKLSISNEESGLCFECHLK